jgi:hypothetical protein
MVKIQDPTIAYAAVVPTRRRSRAAEDGEWFIRRFVDEVAWVLSDENWSNNLSNEPRRAPPSGREREDAVLIGFAVASS